MSSELFIAFLTVADLLHRRGNCVKVEETDWLDISADLADVDDNTLDSQEIDENMVMLEDLQLNDDDDDNGVMEFDEGTL